MNQLKSHWRFKGWAWCFAGLLLLWLIGVSTYIIWVGWRDEAAPSDVVIVLGAAAYDARPSPVFEERLRHGIHLYKEGLAQHMIFTGGFGGAGARFSESQVGERYARKAGVPDQAILIETTSHTTRQNLQQAARLMREHQLHTAIIVSDPLHMARAMRLAEDEGIDAVASATPTSRFRSFSTRWRFFLQELYFFHRDMVLEAV